MPHFQEFDQQIASFQVIDLHDLPPEAGLEWCHLIPDVQCRVLVAGGDGTVCWVMNAIENLNLNVSVYLTQARWNELLWYRKWCVGFFWFIRPFKTSCGIFSVIMNKIYQAAFAPLHSGSAVQIH